MEQQLSTIKNSNIRPPTTRTPSSRNITTNNCNTATRGSTMSACCCNGSTNSRAPTSTGNFP
jgi:hypothetical protein